MFNFEKNQEKKTTRSFFRDCMLFSILIQMFAMNCHLDKIVNKDFTRTIVVKEK